MSSLVLSLQKEASKGDSNISKLLRQAYIVAKKLNTHDFEKWIKLELDGYGDDYDNIPDYRNVYGDTRGMHPYRGVWLPILVGNDELNELLNRRVIYDSVLGLESLLKSDSKEFTLGFNNAARRQLSEWFGYDTNFTFFFNRSQVETILEKIRTIVLEWSLKLEEQGILGEEMTFNQNEKEKANSISNTNNYFFGDIRKSQLQLNSVNSSQNMDVRFTDIGEIRSIIDLIKENVEKVELSSEQVDDVEKQIDKIEKAINSGTIKKSVAFECLSSIRNIMEGITGSIIASGIIHEISRFLAP